MVGTWWVHVGVQSEVCVGQMLLKHCYRFSVQLRWVLGVIFAWVRCC